MGCCLIGGVPVLPELIRACRGGGAGSMVDGADWCNLERMVEGRRWVEVGVNRAEVSAAHACSGLHVDEDNGYLRVVRQREVSRWKGTRCSSRFAIVCRNGDRSGCDRRGEDRRE